MRHQSLVLFSSKTIRDDVENSMAPLSLCSPSFSAASKYFEATLQVDPHELLIGIGFKSGNSSVTYMLGSGTILTDDGCTYSGKSTKEGDIIGIAISMDIYECENQRFHHVHFYKNGVLDGHPIIFNADGPISAIFAHAKKNKTINFQDFININFGDHPFHSNTGKNVSTNAMSCPLKIFCRDKCIRCNNFML